MRSFGKRFWALICCITLAAALATTATATAAENCPGGCAHQAAIGTTHYDTLAEALLAAADGNTVTVLSDIADAGALTLDKAITLDLGGKTVTGQNTGDDALLTTTADLTVTNGTMATSEGAVLLVTDAAVTMDKTASILGGNNAVALILQSLQKDAAADIRGKLVSNADSPALGAIANGDNNVFVTIQSTASITAEAYGAMEVYGSGKLTITGGTITAKEAAIVLNVFDGKTMDASITGGKFLVADGKTLEVTAGTNATAPKDFVIGGTYNKVPTEYIPDYCRVEDNGDGTYTVTAEYAISFEANGASGTMTAGKADRGTTITLPNCGFTAPSGKHFAAWEIGGTTYAPGASFAVNAPVTLKAIWQAHTGGSATCTAKAVCSVCGSSYGELASHNLYQVSAYAATCTGSGMNSHSKCSACGQLFVSGIPIRASSLTIPALGHRMQTVEGTDATCTEDGVYAHEICAFCGLLQLQGEVVSEEALVIPAAGHKLKTVPAVAATCTQPGTLAHEACTVCNTLFVKGQPTEADALATELSSHVLSDWQSDAATHWKVCTQCSEVFRQHSHKDADGNKACDDCGYAMPAPQVPDAKEETNRFSFSFLIPLVAAVVIAAGGVVIAVKKKSK